MVGRTNALLQALVSSVNGMAGVVTLNSNIAFNRQETYDSGTLGEAVSDATEIADYAIVTPTINNFTSNGMTFTALSDYTLQIYGTAAASRHFCFINGQESVKTTTSPFTLSLKAGTYNIEYSVTGSNQNAKINYTTTNFSNKTQLTSGRITFQNDIMLGVYFSSSSTWGDAENPTVISFRATKIVANDDVVRKDAETALKLIDSEDEKTNVIHQLVDYGYDTPIVLNAVPSASTVVNWIHIEQYGTQVFLNLEKISPSYAIRIKISDKLQRAASNNDVDAWTNGINLIEGHKYRASLNYISGTITLDEGVNPPYLSVYNVGTHDTIGELTRDGYTSMREFIAGSSALNLVIYIPANNMVTNVVYQALLEDITEGLDPVSLKATALQSRREYLGPNILAGIGDKVPSSNLSFLNTNKKITITNSSTATNVGVRTYTEDYRYKLSTFLVPGHKYRMHMVAETVSGSPYICMAIIGTEASESGIATQIDGEGEHYIDFVADSYMKYVELFAALGYSTQNSSVAYSDVWIKEIFETTEDIEGQEKINVLKEGVEGVISFKNLLNPNDPDVEDGRAITGSMESGFVWVSGSTLAESGYIPCKPYDHIYLVNDINSSTPSSLAVGNTVAFYDSSKNELVAQYPGCVEGYYIAPLNAAYFRVPISKTDAKKHVVSAFIADPIYEPLTLPNLAVLDSDKCFVVPYGLEGIKTDYAKTQWYNKSWYGYGTSITNTNNEGKYPFYVAKLSGLIFTNKGISGGGIGNLGAYSTGQVYNAICNTSDGKLAADLITLETGANDVASDTPLGTIYDTGTSTLAGCLNDCIRYLQENTSAQIAIFCSPSSKIAPTTESHRIYEWYEMIPRICRINRVHFINSDCNLGSAKLNSSSGSNYVVDSIHQTELGAYIYAQNIWAQLKNIPVFSSTVDI